jgi:antirestriction protein ArdC
MNTQTQSGGSVQFNLCTGKPYKGKNQEILQEAKKAKGYNEDGWMTFWQTARSGMKVRKGEKGTRILAIGEKTNKDGTKDKEFGGDYWVFNIDQTQQA